MIDVSLVQAAASGLFALLGAFAGAALTRRTEYEKWLRQERTAAFGEFLRELHGTRMAVTAAYYDEEGTEQTKSIKATEAFVRLQKHAGIARLFMSEAGRTEYAKSLNDLWVNCTVHGGPANRVSQLKVLMDTIQVLLERELNYLPSRFPWKFK